MHNRLDPNPASARELRNNMDAALVNSVASLLVGQNDKDTLSGQSQIPPDRGVETRALDYGAYFDLALDGATHDLDRVDARRYLRQRWPALSRHGEPAAESPATSLSVTTLSSDFYSPAELRRFSRWWDIEPDNRMALTAVTKGELALARACIEQALAYLETANPAFHDEFCTLVREIVIARPDGSQRLSFGGVSSFTLWGAISLNYDAHDGWPRYYQSLVHEAAHTLLFAIAREEPLVLNSPDETFGSPLRQDLRPMDGLFHAAFVSVREALALDALLCRHEDECLLAEGEVGAVSNLLDGSVMAFWDCAGSLHRDGQLSPLGADILLECEVIMKRNFALQAG